MRLKKMKEIRDKLIIIKNATAGYNINYNQLLN